MPESYPRPRIYLRVPDPVHDAILEAALDSGRSFRSEVTKRLADSVALDGFLTGWPPEVLPVDGIRSDDRCRGWQPHRDRAER